jgi:hypothetical protein
MLQIPPHSLDEPQKVLVMVYDWFYVIDVYHSAPTSTAPDHSNPMPLVDDAGVLEERLRAVVVDARGRRQRGERAVPVGVLSADNRDVWAKVHTYFLFHHLIVLNDCQQNLDYLLKLSPTNESVLRAVQHSIVAVSLDDWTYPHLPSRDDAPHPPVFASGTPPNDIDAHLHNTRSSHAARNRWFDKAFTLILESTARAGVMGEHSPVDALVPSMAGEYAVIEPVNSAAFVSPEPVAFPNVSAARPSPIGWSRLDWVVDEYVRRECMVAEERARNVIDDSDDNVLWFTDYGSDWIKTCMPWLCRCHVRVLTRASASVRGRVRPDGATARMVPRAEVLHGYVRDCAHAALPERPHGNDPDVFDREPSVRAWDDGRVVVGVFGRGSQRGLQLMQRGFRWMQRRSYCVGPWLVTRSSHEGQRLGRVSTGISSASLSCPARTRSSSQTHSMPSLRSGR